LIPRFDTKLSNYAALSGYAAHRNASRFVRNHSRMSVLAAAALTAGGISVAGAAAGTTPWDESTHLASGVVSGQAGTSVSDSIAGLKSPAAHQQSPTQVARLDSRPVGVTRAAAKASHPSTRAAAPPAPVAKAAAPPAPVAKVAGHPAKKAPAHPAPAHPAPAKPHAAAPPTAALPYLIYDSVTPTSVPWGKSVAAYANGHYRASVSDVAHHDNVLWIDINGSNPDAMVLDVEPGDATPAGAAHWVRARLNRHRNSIAIVYTFRAAWPSVKHHVRGLPSWMRSRVHYWIADPTGVPHVIPGSSATQWYWGKHYDISTAKHNFQIP
jgi:hypothetical protein